MLASELFAKLESEVPRELTVTNDIVGFIGPGDPDKLDVKKVLVVLDYQSETQNSEFDLVISHHPPLITPKIPTYILHSNWDVVSGGANDALADILNLEVLSHFDETNGIGRLCAADITLNDFHSRATRVLMADHIKMIPGDEEHLRKVAIISGFGLNPEYITLAYKKGANLILSGDLTHKGAITAKSLGISVIDATHQATEIPGLLKLCQLISKFDCTVEFEYPVFPWNVTMK